MRSFGLPLAVFAVLASVQGVKADAGVEWNQYVDQRENDLRALRACIETDEFLRTGAACAKMTVPACVERLVGSGKPVSRVTEDGCWEDEFRLWDLLYGEVVQQVLEGVLFLDRDAFTTGSKNTGNMELFLQAEAGWLSNIADQCRLDGAHIGAGTARSTTYYSCRIDLYSERVSNLRNLGLMNFVR